MNKLLKPKNLPLFAAAAGITGWLLRKQLYVWGIDDKGLMVRNHPLELLLLALTAVTLGVLILSVRKLGGSEAYADNFGPSNASAVTHALAGLAFVLTVLLNEPGMGGNLGIAWKVLGILSGPCFLLAGLSRLKGKQPFFVLHMVPCLFLVLHIVNHYQAWSGNPQVQDYIFSLFGTIAVILFAYYTAAFDADTGKRKMHLFTGLAATYLCLVILARTEYLLLYAGCLLWVQSDLCALVPKPQAPEAQKGDVPNEPA